MSRPHSIRIIHFRDRLVLEDISDQSVKPGVIDDWATASGGDKAASFKHKSLVFPFDGSKVILANNKDELEQHGGAETSVGVDYAVGFLGVLGLPSGPYMVLVRQTRVAGSLPSADVFSINKVLFFKIHSGEARKVDRDVASSVAQLLESGFFYFCYDADLTQSMTRIDKAEAYDSAFWWTFSLVKPLPNYAKRWGLRAIYGFVESFSFRLPSMEQLDISLVSRRSRRRSGTRYMSRGVDNAGDVSNFVETEQVVWSSRLMRTSAYRILRGSIPSFWRQNDGALKPPPEISAPLVYSRPLFRLHFKKLTSSYGQILAVSLVSFKGSEAVLCEMYERLFELDHIANAQLLAFDFHAHCAGREQERGKASLLSRLKPFLYKHGVHSVREENRRVEVTSRQTGSLRVNCVDCLDRTNVVQSHAARVALSMQIKETTGQVPKSIGREAEDAFRAVWARNADAISIQYAGTKAMKTDMTKTGKRSTSGKISDGVKSVKRMYYKNVIDENRQDIIDLMTGYATYVQMRTLSHTDNPVWAAYSDAQLVSAGGDRQESRVEIREESLLLKTPEGLGFEYKRGFLFSFERDNHRSERPRLKLHFRPGTGDVSPASSPLVLQFRKNPGARERFLRMLLLWSDLPQTKTFGTPIRVRVVAYEGSQEPFRLKSLDLPSVGPDHGELLCIVRPRASTRSRDSGLACVPVDVDDGSYVLIDVASSSRVGPNIAILASRAIASSVMQVENQSTRLPTGHNNVSVISLAVAGTSVCFVGAVLQRPADFPSSIGSINIGRHGFDISSQYEHFFVGGSILSSQPGAGKEQVTWKELGQGFWSRILRSGHFALRYSFPGSIKQDLLRENDPVARGERSTVLLVDEVIQGAPAPFIPNTAYTCSVLIEDLRAYGVKHPKNNDPKLQLDAYLTVQCDLAVEYLSTRLSGFTAGGSPSWIEPQLLQLIPSDRDEVKSSYIFGQVMIASAYGDDIPSGSFVIPLSRGGVFSVPIRLSSKLVGRLDGTMSLSYEEVDPLSAGIAMDMPDRVKTKRSNSRKMKNFIGKYVANTSSSSRIADPGKSDLKK